MARAHARAALNPDDPIAYHEIGHIHEGEGRARNALVEFSEGLEKLSEKQRGGPQERRLLAGRGRAYELLSRYPEALADLTTVLAMLKGRYGEHHTSVADGLCRIADVHSANGENEAAMCSYQEALAIYQEIYGEVETIEIAWIWEGMGDVHCHKNDYPRAMTCFQRSLAIHERLAGGREDLGVVGAQHSLGKVLAGIGRSKEGVVLLEQSLATKEALSGGQATPSTASTLLSLGSVHRNQRMYSMAVDCCRRALEIFQDYYGDGPHIRLHTLLEVLALPPFETTSLRKQSAALKILWRWLLPFLRETIAER